MKTYEISRDPKGVVTCLVHEPSKLIRILIPQGVYTQEFDNMGNGALELTLAILVDYFNEIRHPEKWYHQQRNRKSWRYHSIFYFDNGHPAHSFLIRSFTEQQIEDWVNEKKIDEVMAKIEKARKR